MSNSTVTTIDDTNSSIMYTPESNWARYSSMTGTNLAHAKALIPFYGASSGWRSWPGLMKHYVGSQICAYGAIQNPDNTKVPVFSCSMDSQPAQSYIPGTVSDGSAECYCNVTFPLAVHILTITNLLNNSFLYLDYFLVSQPTRNASAAISSASISTSISPSPSLIPSPSQTYNQPFQTYSSSISNGGVTVYSPTISPDTVINPTPSSSQNRVKLIGGIVGGLALLIIAGLMGVSVWFVRRRRRANRWKAPSAMFINSSTLNPDYTPYTGSKAYLKH